MLATSIAPPRPAAATSANAARRSATTPQVALGPDRDRGVEQHAPGGEVVGDSTWGASRSCVADRPVPGLAEQLLRAGRAERVVGVRPTPSCATPACRRARLEALLGDGLVERARASRCPRSRSGCRRPRRAGWRRRCVMTSSVPPTCSYGRMPAIRNDWTRAVDGDAARRRRRPGHRSGSAVISFITTVSASSTLDTSVPTTPPTAARQAGRGTPSGSGSRRARRARVAPLR